MRKVLPTLGIFVVYVGVSLLFFLPILKNFSGLLPDDYDGLIITWHLNKFVQNPTLVPEKLFQGNILYPNSYTQAFTDPYLTDSLIAYPFVKIFNEPIVAFNINLIVSQVLLLFFTFLFLKQLTKDFLVSGVLSIVFCFSAIRLHYIGHLQMFSLYWVPLAGYFLLKLSESKKTIFIYLFFLSFLLQTLNSFLPGYFIIFMTLGMFFGVKDLRQIVLKNYKHLIIAALLTLIVLLPYVRIYYLVSLIYDYSRPIRDAINFSLSPEEIFTKFFSPVILILLFFSILYFWQRKLMKIKIWLFLTIGAFILTLGPALHFFGKTIKVFMPLIKMWLPIPLPYTLAYYLLPGFNGFRTPSRWIFMFGLLAIVCSAIVLTDYFKKRSLKAKILFLFLTLLMTVFTAKKVIFFPIPNISQYPKVYSWLKNQPGKVIMEMPVYFWRNLDTAKLESYRMLFELYHNKLMVNGISGFTPPLFEKDVEFLQKSFPDSGSMTLIKSLKVEYLIIHKNELKVFWKEKYGENITLLEKNIDLKKLYDENEDLVFQII